MINGQSKFHDNGGCWVNLRDIINGLFIYSLVRRTFARSLARSFASSFVSSLVRTFARSLVGRENGLLPSRLSKLHGEWCWMNLLYRLLNVKKYRTQQ